MVCEVEAGLPRERLFPFVPLSLSLSLSLSLALFVLLSSFRKTFTVKKQNGDLDLQPFLRQGPSHRGLISPR